MCKCLLEVNKYTYRHFANIVKDIIFVKKYQTLKNFVQHGNTSTYKHLISVAILSIIIIEKFHLKVNLNNLIYAALLHDYVFYDWHTFGDKFHGFHHPKIAADNAKNDFNINDCVYSIIDTHMWPLTITKVPKSKEAFIVCVADKICSINETICI